MEALFFPFGGWGFSTLSFQNGEGERGTETGRYGG